MRTETRLATCPLIQAEPPQETPQLDRDSPRLCTGAFGLQKICQAPDGDEGARMHGTELIFPARQGPAMELFGLAQGGLWVGHSRLVPYVVARWASCCDLPLIVQTSKPTHLKN